MYIVNIDRLTGTVKMHLADSLDPRCDSQQKISSDGVWRLMDTEDQARTLADLFSMRLEPCEACKP